ncbi:MAG: hypothetical protein PHC61_02705 [Chitinivibrionales bacterium]|nr:hypothetical protein [Chitinivibrionales bacterium]
MLDHLQNIKASKLFLDIVRQQDKNFKAPEDIDALNKAIQTTVRFLIWGGFEAIRKEYFEPEKPRFAAQESFNAQWQKKPRVSIIFPLPLRDYSFAFKIPDSFRKDNVWAYSADDSNPNTITNKTILYCLEALNCGVRRVKIESNKYHIIVPHEMRKNKACNDAETQVIHESLLATYKIKGNELDAKPIHFPLKWPSPYRSSVGTLSLLIHPVIFFPQEQKTTPYFETIVAINWDESIGKINRDNDYWENLRCSIFEEIGKKPEIDYGEGKRNRAHIENLIIEKFGNFEQTIIVGQSIETPEKQAPEQDPAGESSSVWKAKTTVEEKKKPKKIPLYTKAKEPEPNVKTFKGSSILGLCQKIKIDRSTFMRNAKRFSKENKGKCLLFFSKSLNKYWIYESDKDAAIFKNKVGVHRAKNPA